MKSLADYKSNNKPSGQSNQSSGGNNQVGSMSFEVSSYDPNTGVIKGKVLVSSVIPSGTEASVKSVEKYAEKNATNLKKGMGATPGSVLLLENCYQTDEAIFTRWITTGISASKVPDPLTGHKDRSVEKVLVEMPRLSFKNPNLQPNEPEYINWPLNAEKMPLRNRAGESQEFGRDWLKEKLSQAEQNKSYVRVTALSPNVDAALKVGNTTAAIDEIESIISEPGSVAMVRVSDGSSLEVRRIYSENKKVGDTYVNDPAGRCAKLTEGGLFKGLLSNEDLDAAMGEGGWTLEVIPAKDLVMIGDTQKLVVSDVMNKSVADLTDYAIRFGANAGETSQCIAITVPTKTGELSLPGLPISFSRDRFNSNYIETKHIQLSPPKYDDKAAAPAPEAGGEEFDGGDFDMKPIDEIDSVPLNRAAPGR